MNIQRRFSIRPDDGGFNYGLYIFVREDKLGGQWLVGTTEPMKVETIKQEDAATYSWHAPTVNLSREECQRLMDALWDAGFKPTGAQGSAGQLTAVQAHLEDMRRFAFKAAGIEMTEEK